MAAGGKSIENISHKLSMSESTVSRRMKKILLRQKKSISIMAYEVIRTD